MRPLIASFSNSKFNLIKKKHTHMTFKKYFLNDILPNELLPMNYQYITNEILPNIIKSLLY